MKKYILVLFVVLFSLVLFPNSSFAVQTYTTGRTYDTSGSRAYTVGRSTSTSATLPSGCTSTVGYSPLTGTKCDIVSNTSTSSLPPGCTSTIGYSPLTGIKCDTDMSSLPTLPAGCTSTKGYSTTTGQKCDETSTPTISSVSGPQTLSLNQTGTWMISASDSSGENLTYTVDWGDQGVYGASAVQLRNQMQQTSTFTHMYTNTGTYTPKFTVTNPAGKSASTSISVKVGSVSSGTITVLSPNGGEIIDIFKPFTVKLKTNNVYPAKHYINLSDETSDHGYSLDSLLGSYGVSFTQSQINQQSQSVLFSIPDSYDINKNDKFKIEICVNNVCDKSDNTFSLTYSSGDVNRDGLINCVDTNMILDAVTGNTSLTPGQKLRADVDMNGNISAYDASLLIQKYNLSCSTTTPTPAPAFSVLSPVSGSKLTVGNSYLVSWTPYTGDFDYYNVWVRNKDTYGFSQYPSTNIYANTISKSKTSVTMKIDSNFLKGFILNSGKTEAQLKDKYYVIVQAVRNSDENYVPKIYETSGYFDIAFQSGDVNEDGFVNCTDVSMINKAVVGSVTLTAGQKERADIDGNGSVQAYDASLLMQKNGLSCSSSVSSVNLSPMLVANTLDSLENDEEIETENEDQVSEDSNDDMEESCTNFSMLLAKGMNNDEVKCLQEKLIEKGFEVEGVEAGGETTYFGYATMTALKRFQNSVGLKADGVFGPLTRAVLEK